jgi:hypothetical protein
MILRQQLLKEHTKANKDKIIRWIGRDQARFDELFSLFLYDEYRVVQRAAWPLSFCVIQYPPLIKKHFGPLVKNLRKPGIHDAVKRNTLRLLQTVEIPKRHQGAIMDLCFTYIATPGEPVAIKAFSLTVLQGLAASYPEIIPEIKLLIEENYERETAAFKSRAKKLLKKIG